MSTTPFPLPLPTGIHPHDLPEIRAELAAWLVADGPDGGPAVWAEGFDAQTAAQERQAAADWAHSLRLADLYFATTDMTRLSVAAGAALPRYRLHHEDLPSHHGLVVWEEPVADAYEGAGNVGAPITAATWAQAGHGVHVRIWVTRENWLRYTAIGDPRIGLRDLSRKEISQLRRRLPQPLVCFMSSYLPFGQVPGWLRDRPPADSGLSLLEFEARERSHDQLQETERALVVTWLLLGQTITDTKVLRAGKTFAKRVARLAPDLPTAVRYVDLRHHRHVFRERHDGEPSIHYQHQWVVHGHWRNHYFPSRHDHRPIWIDDYLKGPDGAPILDPDKLVHVLRH
ncbi:hypothetical protein ABT093_36075 [Kitasatospora sp. NPDC002551]|uniref:hypothetical protein n=1 Tax=Kitasatospora sp. NPDC002551 TaxID=3154539 RepID=UPI00332F9A09